MGLILRFPPSPSQRGKHGDRPGGETFLPERICKSREGVTWGRVRLAGEAKARAEVSCGISQTICALLVRSDVGAVGDGPHGKS